MDQWQTLIGLAAAVSGRILPFLLAALVLLVAALALRRMRPRWLAVTAWAAVAVLSLAAAGFADAQRHHAEQQAARDAVARRIGELTDNVLAPGSALACLDAMAGETVESACEKALFSYPQTVAAAVAYTASRLALLQETFSLKPAEGARRLDRMVARLQRGLDADRFGFVAYVLSARYGCKVDSCPQFTLLADASIVKINLQAGTYESYVAKYQLGWSQDKGSAVARAMPSQDAPGETARAALEDSASRTGGEPSGPAHDVKNPIDYPTAAEIPPVSIMDPEPASGPLRGSKAARKENQKPAATHARSEKPKAAHAPPLPRSSPKAASSSRPESAQAPSKPAQ